MIIDKEWVEPCPPACPPAEIEDGCPHNMGTYQAEAISNGQHHYRCNGCNIILATY